MAQNWKIAQAIHHLVDPADGNTLQAQNWIKDHVDPQHRVDRWHHEKRRDQQNTCNAPPWEAAVYQHSNCQTQDHGQHQNAANDEQTVCNGDPEIVVVQHIDIIAQTAPVI